MARSPKQPRPSSREEILEAQKHAQRVLGDHVAAMQDDPTVVEETAESVYHLLLEMRIRHGYMGDQTNQQVAHEAFRKAEDFHAVRAELRALLAKRLGRQP